MSAKKNAIIISVVIFIIIAAAAAAAILFATAKPLMFPAFMQSSPYCCIHLYNFNGMSFSPYNSYIARNYSDEDGSRIDNMAIEVNNEIQVCIFNYVNEKYSVYHLNADIAQNGKDKTVIKFHGNGIPKDGGESELITIVLTVDWDKAIENNGNFINIS